MSGDDGDGEYNPEAVDQDEDNEQDAGPGGYEAPKEQILLLVDAHANMLSTVVNNNDVEQSLLEYAVEFAMELMKARITSSTSDELGVIFYGAAKSNIEGQVFEHVFVYAPLDVPDAATIRKLQDFSGDKFEAEIGSSASAEGGDGAAEDLRFALWAAREVFSKKTSKASKRVVLLSATENPCPDTRIREQVLGRAEQLHEARVQLDFIPLGALLAPFDTSVFWSELVRVVAGDEDEAEDNTAGTGVVDAEKAQLEVDTVYDMLLKRRFKKRPVASVKWFLSSDTCIAVQSFSLVQPAVKRPPIKVAASDYAPLKSDTAYYSADASTLLTDINRRYYKGPDKDDTRYPRVVLHDSEVADIKRVRPPGMTLLGFKPLSALQDYHQLSHANFVYPNESALRGSTAAFVALHAAMLAQQRFALCSYVRGARASPQLVALLAQEEQLDDANNQVQPPGMHMVHLPFADDLRSPELDPSVLGSSGPAAARADEAQIAAAEELLSALTIEDWSPALVHNPSLARHYQVIEAVALGEAVPDVSVLVDEAAPDKAWLDEQAAAIAEAFKDACFGKGWAEEAAARAAAGGKKGVKRKEAPEMSPAEAYQQHNWPDLVNSGGLSKLTNDKLKVYLAYHRLPVSGKKADLVDRITQHLVSKEEGLD